MKTTFLKSMITSSVIMMSLLIAQAQDATDFVSVKIITNQNGIVTTIDTSFSCSPDFNIENFIQSLCPNMPASMPQIPDLPEIENGDGKKKIIIKTEKVIMTGDSSNISISVDGDPQTGDSIHVVTVINDDENINVEIGNEKVVKKKIIISENDVKEIDGENSHYSTNITVIKVRMENPAENERKSLIGKGTIDNDLVSNLTFFPNPGNGQFNLQFTTRPSSDIDIEILDVNGKRVYNESIKNCDGNYNKYIDISKQAKGTYFLKIHSDKKTTVKKLIID